MTNVTQTISDVSDLPFAKVVVHVSTADEILAAADDISESFPEAIHIGFGGRVSRGRLCDALSDEVFGETPQIVVVEMYEAATPEFFSAAFLDANAETTVVFISTPDHLGFFKSPVGRNRAIQIAF